MSGRRYGEWPGKPKGVLEDPECCVKEIFPTTGSFVPHQCRRKRGHGENGEYCSNHSKPREQYAFRHNVGRNGRNEN